LVLDAVPGNERHRPALDRPHRDRGGRFSKRRVDLDFTDVLEERIEARPPEDPDPDGLVSLPAQALFSFVVELAGLSGLSDFPDFSDFSDLATAVAEASPREESSALSPPPFEAAPTFDLESVE
jgi:hypothetical protein